MKRHVCFLGVHCIVMTTKFNHILDNNFKQKRSFAKWATGWCAAVGSRRGGLERKIIMQAGHFTTKSVILFYVCNNKCVSLCRVGIFSGIAAAIVYKST